MGRPTTRGEPLDIVASVRVSRSEADRLRSSYGSVPKGLRALIDTAWGHGQRCRIHTYDAEPSVKVENGLTTTIKKCSTCGYVSVSTSAG